MKKNFLCWLVSLLSQVKAPKLCETMLNSKCWGWRVPEQSLRLLTLPEVCLLCLHK